MIIAVCKINGFDYKQAALLGYNSKTDFLLGDAGNTSIFSWSGLDANLTYTEIETAVFKFDRDNVIFEHNVTNEIKLVIKHGMCKLLKVIPKEHIMIEIKQELEAIITISDPSFSSYFQLSDDLTTGERIFIKATSKSKRSRYKIQLEEHIRETYDATCANYPTARYDKFEDCIAHEYEEQIMSELGCMIPWMSSNKQCSGLVKRLPKHESLVRYLISTIYAIYSDKGIVSAICLPPCTIRSVHSTFLTSFSVPNMRRNQIHLNFQPAINVRKVVLAYDLGALLVEVGSCLGLWLGLSVIGVYETIVYALWHLLKMFKRICKSNLSRNIKATA